MRSSRRRLSLTIVAVVAVAVAAPSSTLAVSAAAPAAVRSGISVKTHTLPDGRVGVAYHDKLAASGAHGSLVWSESGLPSGLHLSSHGVLSGKPKHAGTAHVKVRVRAGGHAASRKLRLVIKPAYPHATSVAVGDTGGQTFACALTTAGAAKCWGPDNTDGELGNGTTKPHNAPANVKGLPTGVRDISLGSEFACAVTAAKAVRCWGSTSEGELGNGSNGTRQFRSSPVAVKGLSGGIRSVSAGQANACAVTTGGAVDCWGSNLEGQLGSGVSSSVTESDVAVPVAGLSSGVASVSVGADFACVLTTAGAVKCWGTDLSGQLGNGGQTESTDPVAVKGLSSGVRSLSAGGDGACAVTAARAAKCWGDNGMGQLGAGKNGPGFSTTPRTVHGLASGQALAAYGSYGTSCAVTTGGAAKCWGYNYDGTLGNGTETNSVVPVKVKGLSSGVKAISVSTYTVCVLVRGGGVKCWGYVQTPLAITDTPVSVRGFS
jgi:alpha-tubulin suppressor-like RCC1 family protein